MVIYLDTLFGLNFLLDYLLLLGSARLGGAEIRRWRMVLAALLGAAYAAASVVPSMDLLRAPGMRALVCVGMLLLAFGCRRRTLRQGALFLALSFAFGGLVLAITAVFGQGLLFIGGAAYYPVSFRALVLTFGAAWLVASTVFARFGQHGGGEIVPVRICAGGHSVQLSALRDTGNTLRDPITNSSVLVANWDVARQLLPHCSLQRKAFDDPASLLTQLAASEPSLRFRLLPYRAVGVAGGLLLALQCDEVLEAGKPRIGRLVAFSPTPVSDDGRYQALTGGVEK